MSFKIGDFVKTKKDCRGPTVELGIIMAFPQVRAYDFAENMKTHVYVNPIRGEYIISDHWTLFTDDEIEPTDVTELERAVYEPLID